jgi:hypothetical protein
VTCRQTAQRVTLELVLKHCTTHWQFGRRHPAVNAIRRLQQRLSETGGVVLVAYVSGDRPRKVIIPANEDAVIAAV